MLQFVYSVLRPHPHPPVVTSLLRALAFSPDLSSYFTLFPCALINYYSLQLNCAMNVKYLG